MAALQAATGYGVSVLSLEQQDLSDQFARSDEDKWENVDFPRGYGGAPLLPGAMAQFECAPYATYDGGDHVIFVCRVVQFRCDADLQPLAFFRGRYMGLDRGDQRDAAWPLAMHY